MNNQPHGPSAFDRDREMEEQHRQRTLQQQQQQEDLAARERDIERQERERQHREQYQPQPPHQSNTGSIPLHQPVANRTTTAMHSPGGILATHGTPLGAPPGPGNAFGGPLHNEAARTLQHHAQNPTQQQQPHLFNAAILAHGGAPSSANVALGVPGVPGVGFNGQLQQQQQQQQDAAAARLMPFGGPITPGHQITGPAVLAQGGQQPILNDALSYLDQVKVQFADQPDVYNRFLDIMKDFKSQAIDTPGVINRVSELFAGHPNLIQGFNTFLPPGYRIECGAGNDPNTIRVTTPMGTTVQSITGSGRALPDTVVGHGGTNGFYNPQRSGNWQPQPQHTVESPEAVFSPPHQGAGAAYNHNQAQLAYEAQAQAAAAHQQQQRGVSQLTSAVSATLGQGTPNAQAATPGGGSGNMNGAGTQPGMEKRGPVEFNHAISYVNKIKNRFQDRPEIYKQFLEILQTYQRESKPIQDVYSQVTTLFGTAPDLLEDFKQFLPESAAHAKAAAKAAEEATSMPEANQNPQLVNRGPGGETKMPLMGNFPIPPASTSKQDKKRKGGPPQQGLGAQMNNSGENPMRGPGQPQPNKRPKTHHNNKPLAADAAAVSPTLTPIVPEPLPPTSTSSASPEELAFFDRVKKYIGNKSTMNEFLKLCNLFSQDLIDRNVLVHKVSNFIGGSADLMNWFKAFVSYEGRDEIIDNRPKAPTGRVALSNCRGLGPSYRLLPKRERLKPCSGRDEMCHSVLNDDWASHPTWASEDSGFVAHRKNIFEEGLHRIEEERHDYDFNIECNAKVIQLLEPIAQQIVAMDPMERENFRMPIGLGGQSQAIYKRVLKKIYGPEKGPQVVVDLFKDPSAVLPVILARLKQKDEEWTFTRREWNPVWGAQAGVMYLKSLDHMGIHVKQADKKNFAAKHLVDSIKTKHEEQRRLRGSKGPTPKYQYAYQFTDQEVIGNVLHMMIVYASNANQHSSSERRRISDFFEKFISAFFDLTDEFVAIYTASIDRGTPDDEYEDIAPAELSNGRGRRPVNGKKGDLRRGVLDKGRNGTRPRGQKDESATGSKESTPDVDSNVDDETPEVGEDRAITEVTNERWAAVPSAVAVQGTRPLESDDIEMKADQPFQRDWYNLYCNQTVFVFFSIFQTLYQRFKDIKDAEAAARAEVERARSLKPAKQIGLLSERLDHFTNLDDHESYYSRVLELVEDYIKGEVEEAKYQDFLRHYYLQTGWKIYTVTDLLKTLCRLGATCSSPDNKEKTPDLIEQFIRNRESKETSFNVEINLRKQADKYIKDGELFLIRWYPKKNEATSQWVHRDETTFDLDIMERRERWQYYTSSYVRIEPTEGVPRRLLRKSLLTRNLPSGDTDSEDGSNQRKPLVWNEDLTLRICVNSFKIIYKEPGSEYFIYTDKTLGGGENGETRQRLKKVEESRNQRFHEKFGMNNRWMKGLNHDEVSKINQDFQKWVTDGVLPTGASSAAIDHEVDMAN
ncbi:Transcriptional regulatory protein sin3 [Clarireedia jacksonii]